MGVFPFVFIKYPEREGKNVPLIALQYHEVKINLEFKPLSQLLVKTAPSGGGSVTVSGGSMGYASLFVDYVYLDTDERRRFAQVSHEYLIEQLQFTGGESVSSSANKLRLNFNHPVKEILWIVQTDAAAAANQWATYTVTGPAGNQINPVIDAKLQLNGHDRFSTRSGAYFNLVQPYQCHTNIPMSRGINAYSFALTPEEHQPSGSCNFSRIDNATLNLTLVPNLGTAQVRIYAINYNVLRIMSGIKQILLCLTVSCSSSFVFILGEINSVRIRKASSLKALYNWLVEFSLCNTSKLFGDILQASTTTLCEKSQKGNQVNGLDIVKTLKYGTIRSQAPKSLCRYGEGSETKWMCAVKSVRYSPILSEMREAQSDADRVLGVGSLIVIRFENRMPQCLTKQQTKNTTTSHETCFVNYLTCSL